MKKMMGYLRILIDQIHHIGNTPKISSIHRRALLMANGVYFMDIILVSIFSVVLWWYGLILFASLTFGGCVTLFIICFYLNYRHYYDLSKLLWFLTLNILVVVYATVLGRSAGIQVALFAIGINFYVMLDYHKKKLIWVGIGLPIFSFLLLEFFNYELFSAVSASSEALYGVSIVVSLFSFFAIFLGVHIFYQISLRSERLEKDLKLRIQSESIILSSIGDGVIIVDENKHILMQNPVAEGLTGYSNDEAIGQPIDDIFVIKDDLTGREISNPIHMAITQKRVMQLAGHAVLVMKNGLTRYIDDSAAPIITEAGLISGGVLVFRDTTNRKEAEEKRVALEQELQQAHKLESLGVLAAGIAHEINTPIQFINDNLYYLNKSMEKFMDFTDFITQLCGSSEKNPRELVQEKIESIKLNKMKEHVPDAISQSMEGISRIREIVHAMREFSHISDQKEKNLFDMAQAVENTKIITRNEWKYAAEFIIESESSLPLCFGYEGEIKQAILNLIVNAAHAIKQYKDVALGRGEIRVKLSSDTDYIYVQITDTGTGIPKDIQDKIFDPFFTTKGVGVGTGQGLTQVYATIVKRHNGKIVFSSEFNKGTQFNISLPRNNI